LKEVEALLSMESYLGDRVGRLKSTLKRLRNLVEIEKVSSIYELNEAANAQRSVLATMDSERWAGGLSIVVKIRTSFSAERLLSELQKVEAQTNTTTRCVDIDLLSFGDHSTMTPSLTLPHPEFHRRPQVLIPAAEVEPTFSHPVLGKTLSELTRRFEKSSWGQYYSTGKTLLDFSGG
jgi:2-amino-4-hydroxy-6-hydroxymethyldihydropteridine diphosphokinase